MCSFGSFSDMIFLFWVCVILFSHEYVLHILCWCVLCFRYETYFHWSIMITWVWPIMEDIEPIDLGLGDRLVSSRLWFVSSSYQSNTISIPWLFRLDDLPILNLTWHHPLVPLYDLYHSYSPLYITVPLPILSIISLIWPGDVRDGLAWGELCMMIDGSWWGSDLTAWLCCWGRWIVMEHPDLSHCTWLQRAKVIRDGDFYETMVSGLWW